MSSFIIAPTTTSSTTGSGPTPQVWAIAVELRGRRARARAVADRALRRQLRGAGLSGARRSSPEQLSKRFLLRHNPAGELKVRLLGAVRSLAPAARRGVLGAALAVAARSTRARRSAMIGRNGSGKSTFLKLVAGIHRPTSGDLLVADGARIGSMIELGTGFHPELTGQENVMLNTSIHGLTQRRGARRSTTRSWPTPASSTSWTCRSRTTRPACTCGSGSRLPPTSTPTSCCSTRSSPSATTTSRSSAWRTLKSFQAQGKTILFVSHSSAAVQAICHRACLLDRGHLLYDGPVDGGADRVPPADRRDRRRSRVRGEPGAAPPPADRKAIPSWPGTASPPAATGPRRANGCSTSCRRQGLRPEHCVLDVGCGSLSAAIRLLPYMERSHYWGYEKRPRALHRRLADRAAARRRRAWSSATSSSTTTSISPRRRTRSTSPSPARCSAG